MSTAVRKPTNANTQLIESELQPVFPQTEAYQFNSASIRVRIIDDRFRHASNIKREELVEPLLEKLPESVQSDVTLLLLLSPDEVETSAMNLEFENPSPSVL